MFNQRNERLEGELLSGERTKHKRLDYIDAAKAVSIIMIMYGHITEIANPVDTWISSCKICSFYVISGFLIAYTERFQKRSSMVIFRDLFSTLAWPYLTFSVLAIASRAFFIYSRNLEPDGKIKSVAAVVHQWFTDMWTLIGIKSMWFLPTLFFAELIILALYHMPKLFSVIYAVGGLYGYKAAIMAIEYVSAMDMSEEHIYELTGFLGMLGKSFAAAWFVGAGYILFYIMKRADMITGHGVFKIAAGTVLSVINLYLSLRNSSVDFNLLKMGREPALFIFGGVFGSLGIILLLAGLSEYISLSGLSYWGRNSLILMCTHTALGFRQMAVAGWDKISYIPEEFSANYVVQTVMALILLMLIMCGVIELINRYMPFLLRFPGRGRQQSKTPAE